MNDLKKDWIELEGSEKQINWANKIRKGFIEKIEHYRLAVTSKSENEGIDLAVALLKKEISAAQWIKNLQKYLSARDLLLAYYNWIVKKYYPALGSDWVCLNGTEKQIKYAEDIRIKFITGAGEYLAEEHSNNTGSCWFDLILGRVKEVVEFAKKETSSKLWIELYTKSAAYSLASKFDSMLKFFYNRSLQAPETQAAYEIFQHLRDQNSKVLFDGIEWPTE